RPGRVSPPGPPGRNRLARRLRHAHAGPRRFSMDRPRRVPVSDGRWARGVSAAGRRGARGGGDARPRDALRGALGAEAVMKRYVVLFVAALALAAVLAGVARAPRAPVAAPAPRAIPEVTLRLTIERGVLTPERSAVPKDHRVRLEVTNRDPRTATLALAGYQDVLAPRAIEPGGVWSDSFVASRPGDDFAWMLDGSPAGQLQI